MVKMWDIIFKNTLIIFLGFFGGSESIHNPCLSWMAKLSYFFAMFVDKVRYFSIGFFQTRNTILNQQRDYLEKIGYNCVSKSPSSSTSQSGQNNCWILFHLRLLSRRHTFHSLQCKVSVLSIQKSHHLIESTHYMSVSHYQRNNCKSFKSVFAILCKNTSIKIFLLTVNASYMAVATTPAVATTVTNEALISVACLYK